MHYYIDLGIFGDINTYSLCTGIGIACMLVTLLVLMKRERFDDGQIAFVLINMVCSFVVGVCFSVLTNALFFLKVNGYAFKYSGLNFYGAMVGGGACYFAVCKIYCKRNTDITVAKLLNVAVCPLVIFHFCGRIGCFLSGCCYGKPTDSPIGVVFPDNEILGLYHGGNALIPTQLIEAAFLLVLSFALLFGFKRHRAIAYLTAYPIFRFVIEFFRGDERGFFISDVLSPAQWISLFLIIIPIAYAVYKAVKYIRRRKSEK